MISERIYCITVDSFLFYMFEYELLCSSTIIELSDTGGSYEPFKKGVAECHAS